MCTSLLPLAWSAKSPWRLLTSADSGSGLVPVDAARISPRFRSKTSFSFSRNVSSSTLSGMENVAPHRLYSLTSYRTGQSNVPMSLLAPQRDERFAHQDVEARDYANHGHREGGHDDPGDQEARQEAPL